VLLTTFGPPLVRCRPRARREASHPHRATGAGRAAPGSNVRVGSRHGPFHLIGFDLLLVFGRLRPDQGIFTVVGVLPAFVVFNNPRPWAYR
jgi:hypothetical protein